MHLKIDRGPPFRTDNNGHLVRTRYLNAQIFISNSLKIFRLPVTTQDMKVVVADAKSTIELNNNFTGPNQLQIATGPYAAVPTVPKSL